MANKNLQHAQKLYAPLANNEVAAPQIPRRIEDVMLKLKQAGVSDLSLLDPSGKTSAEEVKLFLESLTQKVELREIASNLQYRIDRMKEAGETQVNFDHERRLLAHIQIPELLEKAGHQHLLENGHAPTIQELEKVNRTLQTEIAGDPLGTGLAKRPVAQTGRG